MSCLYILEINPLSVALFANIFPYSEGCLFLFFKFSFAVQKLSSLIRSHLLIFVFISITLGDGSKKDIAAINVNHFYFKTLFILNFFNTSLPFFELVRVSWLNISW